MGKKGISRVILILIILHTIFTMGIYATEVDTEQESGVVEGQEEGLSKKGKIDVVTGLKMGGEETEYLKMTAEGLMEGDTIKYGLDSAAYEGLLAEITKSIEIDGREGLTELREAVPTRDSIEMLYWGPFLEKYIGKPTSAYPSEDITIVLQNRTLQIKTDKRSREWLHDTIIPKLVDTIVRVSDEFPVVQYNLEVGSGEPLTDLNLDVEALNLVEGKPIYPLTGIGGAEEEPQIVIYNTGVSYGFMLHNEYLRVLKGYHDENEDMYGVKGKLHPGSVEILAYITTPRNLRTLDLDEMTIKDFGIYEDLAVNLITKELVNLKNLSNTGRKETYKDFRIDEEELLVVPIKDAVVIVQPKFLEGIRLGKYEFLTEVEVDFTGILTKTSDKVIVDGKPEGLETYRNQEGFIDVHNGNRSPFILFARAENLPYERIIGWAYGKDYDLRYKADERDRLVAAVKEEMYSKGLKAEYTKYMKKAGQGSSKIYKKIIPVILIIMVAIVVFIRRSRGKSEEEIDEMLFGDDDDDY